MIELDATLVTTGALRISTGVGDATSDAPVQRDQTGRPVIAGTSLAGALRAAAVRRYGDDKAAELFGPLLADGAEDASRSQVAVRTAWALDDEVPPVQLRDHVGIDRERLAARDGIKFDEETWPLGLRFGLRLELADEELLSWLLGALEELCGPAGGVGAGPCTVELDGDVEATRRADRDETVAAATSRWNNPNTPHPTGPALDGLPAAAPADNRRRTVAVRLRFTTAVPLACREPMDPFSAQVDNLPFSVIVRDGDGYVRRPAIPGSSLLGVLRQRAERALGRATASVLPGPWADEQDPRIAMTFGTAAVSDEARAGAIRVPDAVATDVTWPGELADLSPTTVTSLPNVELRQRVKLDRLTHSTLGGGKFDDTVVTAGTTFDVTVTVAPPDRDATDEDVALLAVGLRDLATGAAGVGGSTRSGYGTLRLVDGHVTDGDATGDLAVTDDGLTWSDDWEERLDDAWHRLASGTHDQGTTDG